MNTAIMPEAIWTDNDILDTYEDVYPLIRARFLDLVEGQLVTYVSANGLISDVRARNKGTVTINNNWSSRFSRDLRLEFPQHAHVFRPRDQKRGKNKNKTKHVDAYAALDLLDPAFTVTGIAVTVKGQSRVLSLSAFEKLKRAP